jgi:hypothetical protein
MSEAPKPPKKAKKKPRAAKEKAGPLEARPLRINTTVYELGPNAPRAKELHERQVKAIGPLSSPGCNQGVGTEEGQLPGPMTGEDKTPLGNLLRTQLFCQSLRTLA